MPKRVSLAGMVKVGFQQITLSNSTAVAINSTCKQATTLFISAETNNARFREDGTAPTLNTGVIIPTGILFPYDGYLGASNSTGVLLKFQRATGTCKLNIMAYKTVGARTR